MGPDDTDVPSSSPTLSQTQSPIENTSSPIENTSSPIENTLSPIENTSSPTENTSSPTQSPIENTSSPTQSPIENTSSPTPLFTVNMTRGKINVIHLPDYKSHDTIDGLFLGVGTFIVLVMLILCLQKINLNNRSSLYRSE